MTKKNKKCIIKNGLNSFEPNSDMRASDKQSFGNF
jgi:hypothetical protein